MEPKQFSYESMGTHWMVRIWDALEEAKFNKLQEEIIKMSQEFDQTYSRFIKTSLVWELATKTGVVDVPADFMSMLRWYEKLYGYSGKKFNPLVGFSLSDLGYDSDYSLVKKNDVRSTPNLTSTVKIINDTQIHIASPVLFDFGALGKGFFVDKIAAYLRAQGLIHFLVDGSGDISYFGNGTPIRAGLEHPGDPTKVIGVIEITQGALCGSGSNRRTWGEYHHIIDPFLLSSPKEIIATWVLADTAVLADGLATCLFLSDPENFEPYFNFEYCMLNQDYKVKRSKGFTAELF